MRSDTKIAGSREVVRFGIADPEICKSEYLMPVGSDMGSFVAACRKVVRALRATMAKTTPSYKREFAIYCLVKARTSAWEES